MATDDDASDADPDRGGDDALEGEGEGSSSTPEGDTVDRATGDSGETSDDGAGGLRPTDDADRPAAGSTELSVVEDGADAPGSPDGATPDGTDEADSPSPDGTASTDADEAGSAAADGPRAAVGEYTWADFLDEYGDDGDVETLYGGLDPREYDADEENERWDDGVEIPTPTRDDWDAVSIDPEEYLGFHPVDVDDEVQDAAAEAVRISAAFEAFCDPETTPVVKDVWLWEHYKREYYYEEDGSRPRGEEGEIDRFDPTEALGFDPDVVENALARGGQRAGELDEIVDERTVDVDPEFDEDAFFSDERGATTVVNRYDLEKAVPMEKKTHFREVERYWVNEPHSFVIIFHSTKENEKKYYVIEPHQNRIEADLAEFLTGKLRTAIKYDDETIVGDAPDTRRRVIEGQSLELLERYNLYRAPEHPREAGLSILATQNGHADEEGGLLSQFDLDLDFDFGGDSDDGDAAGASRDPTSASSKRSLASLARSLGLKEGSLGGRLDGLFEPPTVTEADPSLDGIAARPESAVLAEDPTELNDYQVEKLLYVLRRDFIGYERIDGIKHDVNVEDISCDGYNSPVFVYHSDYEQIISNVYHGEEELDDFVVKLAQRSGKGISKRRPQVDATLPDGSRAQLTLGREVSDHGTNYTIRQFKDVPFTPIDLVNWKTFSLEEMAFLWLCIENDKSLIFAGGTASGKTTSLNAVSLFIPSNSKIVSIEDTREVELPQRNWVASVTRPSFSDDDRGDVDEFDLLEAALRQRPDYIVMGEIRGEEGRTLFQVMSTGHTTYTTFHADSVGEVLKRFTTDPINVSKTMFTALDLVSVQTSTRVQGDKVRRNKSLTEINHYDAENDEINVQDVYQWQAEGDEFLKMGSSNTLEDVRFDRGWSREQLDEELFKRRVVLAYLIDRGLNTYSQVAATLQAFINDQETILALMARDDLERSLEDLREMESVQINVDPEKEEMVPRPSAGEEVRDLCAEILGRAEEELWPDYRDLDDVDVADALIDVDTAPDVTAAGGDHPELDALEERAGDPELEAESETPALGDDADMPAFDDDTDTPALGDGSEPADAAPDGDTDVSLGDPTDSGDGGDLGIEDLLEGPADDGEPIADESEPPGDDTAVENGGEPDSSDSEGHAGDGADVFDGDAGASVEGRAGDSPADGTGDRSGGDGDDPSEEAVDDADGSTGTDTEVAGEEIETHGEDTELSDSEDTEAPDGDERSGDSDAGADTDTGTDAEATDEAWDFGAVEESDTEDGDDGDDTADDGSAAEDGDDGADTEDGDADEPTGTER
ncbi:ATPase, T2SS/T4P/T4SS family [Halobellus rarus]|uniref:ATPase, T2SS/T4P/T4SS family n=1 Tax=Halobellus rarus TaxID=1126237 RepID=A0ABD6CIA2_9EURY|nr:ATPase, T2SS/T4P/T4SS family [Halobellus rarus]